MRTQGPIRAQKPEAEPDLWGIRGEVGRYDGDSE